MTNEKLRWIARFLELVGAIALTVSAATNVVGPKVGMWISLISVVVLLAAGRVRGWLPPKKRTGRAAIIGLLAVFLLGGCGYAGLARGYQSLRLVKTVGNQVDVALAAWLGGKVTECIVTHGTKTPEARACIVPHVDRVKQWHLARASINAAQETGYASLLVYHDHLDGKAGGRKLDVIKVIAVSVCGAVKAILQFQDLIKAKALLGGLSAVKGLVCL